MGWLYSSVVPKHRDMNTKRGYGDNTAGFLTSGAVPT